MQVYKYTPSGYMGSNMYLIVSSGKGAIVDPSIPYSDLDEFIKKEKIEIKYIILTHAHFDHIYCIDSWVNQTKAEVIVGKDEAYALNDSYANCYRLFFNTERGYSGAYLPVSENDVLELGDEKIKIIDTPGHTKGGISLLVSDRVFVGDLVFSGNSYGRCDLPGASFEKLMSSIEKIKSLPENTRVYSGHGDDTDIAEIKSNFI